MYTNKLYNYLYKVENDNGNYAVDSMGCGTVAVAFFFDRFLLPLAVRSPVRAGTADTSAAFFRLLQESGLAPLRQQSG